VVDVTGTTIRVLSGDGEEEIGVFPRETGPETMKRLREVLIRARNIADLSQLENRASQISLNARIVQGGNRENLSATHLQDPIFHIGKHGAPRSLKNSLQLEIESNTDGYITLLNVGAIGEVDLLFPNQVQSPLFHADGFVHAGRKILIPDSLEETNQAGFYWDMFPPVGLQTIWVHVTTNRRMANRIRRYIQSLVKRSEGGVSQHRGVGHPTTGGFRGLRQELLQSLTVNKPTEKSSSSARRSLKIRGETPEKTLGGIDWTAITLNLTIQ